VGERGERDRPVGQIARGRPQPRAQTVGVGQPAGGELGGDELGELGLAGVVVGEDEEADDPLAGVPAGQRVRQPSPRLGVGRRREEAVAVDRIGEGLGLAAQRRQDVAVVDDMNALAVAAGAAARMGHDMGGAEPGLDAVVVEVDPQAVADEARRGAVEDLLDDEAAGAGDAGDDLGEVGGAPRRQRTQGGTFGAQALLAPGVAAGDDLIDEAAIGVEAGEVAAAAQDQRLVERGLQMAVVGLDGAVLVRLAGVVAAGDEAVVRVQVGVAAGDVLDLVARQVAVG